MTMRGAKPTMRVLLSLTFPMPPTSNHIYVNLRGRGGRMLSQEATRYQAKVRALVVQELLRPENALLDLAPDRPYGVWLRYWFERIETVSPGAKHRFVRQDLPNRDKLLVDTVSDALGLDDLHIFFMAMDKWVDPANPRVHYLLLEMKEVH